MRSIDRILATQQQRLPSIDSTVSPRVSARRHSGSLPGVDTWSRSSLPSACSAVPELRRRISIGLQARTYAVGRLWVAGAATAGVLRDQLCLCRQRRAFGVFRPDGRSCSPLRPGSASPSGPSTRRLGGLTVWLVFVLGRRLGGDREGLAAGVARGRAPFFLFNAASHFAHHVVRPVRSGRRSRAVRYDKSPGRPPR